MSKHSRVSPRVSPLLWLVPVPFVLAAFLPVDLPRTDAPVAAQQVAAASADQETTNHAASAPAEGRGDR